MHAQFKIFIPEYSVKHVLFNELLTKNIRECAKKLDFFVLNVNDSRVDCAVNNLCVSLFSSFMRSVTPAQVITLLPENKLSI